MPLIPKHDVNQIFASQAPAQDTPPEFKSYTGGWGVESRPNNGKPTIKGFNKLQQVTDEKLLWIHQNGAALPFDENTEYAENIVVVKDGVLQQRKFGNWTSFLSEGDFGFGSKVSPVQVGALVKNSFASNNGASGVCPYGSYILSNYNNTSYAFVVGARDYPQGQLTYYVKQDGVWTSKIDVRDTRNTTVDSNGFVKAASPIVQLFSDKIELNDEANQQEIIFEKLGIGDYLIKGSTGFSNDGWYIETPKDANGNLLVAVVYEQLKNGDISVKTYDYMLNKKGRIVADTETPLDIPETRWIDLRLQELPSNLD